jgi:pimeloyl-ACP methyl ester carboxylesterase
MQLIFIHGSGGCKESWQFQTKYFDESEAINLPGHPDGDLCPTINEYVEWLREYIQSKGYRDVVLVGHSLGGGIALQYALDDAENLKAIILIGSGARLKVSPDILEMLERAKEDNNLFIEFLKSIHVGVRPELIDIVNKRSEENGPASFLNDLKACDRFDTMDQISSIKLPVLALCGDQDIMTPPKYSQYLANNMYDAKAEIVPGGNHHVHTEKPSEVNHIIETFLQRL